MSSKNILSHCIIKNDLLSITYYARSKKPVILREIHVNNIIKYNRVKLLNVLCSGKIYMVNVNENHIIDSLLSKRQYEILIIMLKNKLFTFVDIIQAQNFIHNMILGNSLEIGKSDHTGLYNMERIILSNEHDVMEALTTNYHVIVSEQLIEHLLIVNYHSCDEIFHILNRIKIIDESSLAELYYKYLPCREPISLKTIPCISFVHYYHEKLNLYRESYCYLYDMTKCSIELVMVLHQIFKKYDNALVDMHVFAFLIRDFLYKHV